MNEDEKLRVTLHKAITGEKRTFDKCPRYECSLGAAMPLWDGFIQELREVGPLIEPRLVLEWEDENNCAEARLVTTDGCLAMACCYKREGEPIECVGARAICKMMLRAIEDHC